MVVKRSMFGGRGEDTLASWLVMMLSSLLNPALTMSSEITLAVVVAREERGLVQPQWS